MKQHWEDTSTPKQNFQVVGSDFFSYAGILGGS